MNLPASHEFSTQDIFWMGYALQLAVHAGQQKEVPVGAVLVKDNKKIGEGYNSPITLQDPTAHAEILALRSGAQTINNYRITQSTLYVTLEPCLMCANAMVHARIARVVYGAADPRTGSIASCMSSLTLPFLNHKIIAQGGLLAQECGSLLSQFFKTKRK